MSHSLKIHNTVSYCVYISSNISVIFHAPRGPAQRTITLWCKTRLIHETKGERRAGRGRVWLTAPLPNHTRARLPCRSLQPISCSGGRDHSPNFTRRYGVKTKPRWNMPVWTGFNRSCVWCMRLERSWVTVSRRYLLPKQRFFCNRQKNKLTIGLMLWL